VNTSLVMKGVSPQNRPNYVFSCLNTFICVKFCADVSFAWAASNTKDLAPLHSSSELISCNVNRLCVIAVRRQLCVATFDRSKLRFIIIQPQLAAANK
jgi:hypothetical protein